MTPEIDYSTVLTPREAAEQSGLTLATIRSLIARGDIESVQTRFGRMISRQSFYAYVEHRQGKVGRPKQSS